MCRQRYDQAKEVVEAAEREAEKFGDIVEAIGAGLVQRQRQQAAAAAAAPAGGRRAGSGAWAGGRRRYQIKRGV